MKIALLIIDLQKAFLNDRKSSKVYKNTLAYINATASVVRKAGCPVYMIRDVLKGKDDLYNSVDELKLDHCDIDLIKKFSNSFWKTDLEAQLKEKNIDFVIVCGTAAEHCVLSTYNGAIERGFNCAILQNGVFADYPEGLIDLYNNRSLISYTTISYLLHKS